MPARVMGSTVGLAYEEANAYEDAKYERENTSRRVQGEGGAVCKRKGHGDPTDRSSAGQRGGICGGLCRHAG